MCNKCVVPATQLLSRWAELGDRPYRHVVIRDLLKEQHQSENREHWSHARHSWVTDYKPRNQQVGHDLAKAKAIVHKQATREPVTLLEMASYTTYFKSLEHIIPNVGHKLEPAYMATQTKFRDGTWEAIDIMNKLHPYPNNTATSSHDAYVDAQTAFITMNRLHNVHISTEDINQIAYYPTLAHMRAGREVRTRLGRYLTKYQSALRLTENDIKNMTEKHASNMRSRGGWAVEFVAHDDPDGWYNVYSGGVQSCMQSEPAVRIYAHEHSVLRLAYVKAGNDIIARCIVREDGDAKGWLRVYPDPNGHAEGRYLLDYLKTHGYDQHTNLDGALLQFIEEREGIVCPYLDYGSGGDQTVGETHHNGKRYLVAGGGDYSATQTNGYVENNMTSCDECGDSIDDDETTYVEHDGCTVCECCLSNNYTYAYGSRYQDYFPQDECVQVGEDYYWVDTIDNHDIGQCERTYDYHPNEELVSTYDGVYHMDYVVSVDRHTDYEYVYMDNVHTLSDGSTCHQDDADHYQMEIDIEAGAV